MKDKGYNVKELNVPAISVVHTIIYMGRISMGLITITYLRFRIITSILKPFDEFS